MMTTSDKVKGSRRSRRSPRPWSEQHLTDVLAAARKGMASTQVNDHDTVVFLVEEHHRDDIKKDRWMPPDNEIQVSQRTPQPVYRPKCLLVPGSAEHVAQEWVRHTRRILDEREDLCGLARSQHRSALWLVISPIVLAVVLLALLTYGWMRTDLPLPLMFIAGVVVFTAYCGLMPLRHQRWRRTQHLWTRTVLTDDIDSPVPRGSREIPAKLSKRITPVLRDRLLELNSEDYRTTLKHLLAAEHERERQLAEHQRAHHERWLHQTIVQPFMKEAARHRPRRRPRKDRHQREEPQ